MLHNICATHGTLAVKYYVYISTTTYAYNDFNKLLKINGRKRNVVWKKPRKRTKNRGNAALKSVARKEREGMKYLKKTNRTRERSRCAADGVAVVTDARCVPALGTLVLGLSSATLTVVDGATLPQSPGHGDAPAVRPSTASGRACGRALPRLVVGRHAIT